MKRAKGSFTKISAIALIIFAFSFGCWLNFAPRNEKTTNAAGADTVALGNSDLLKTSGKKIINQNGQEVTLRGLNIGMWFSRSYWGLPITAIAESDISSAVNNIQMNYDMWTNCNSNPSDWPSGKSCSVAVDDLNDTFLNSYISDEDVDAIAATGANVVRIPLDWSTFYRFTDFKIYTQDGYSYEYNPGGSSVMREGEFGYTFNDDVFNTKLNILENIVNKFGAKGIYVVLDLHIAPGHLNGGGYRETPDFFATKCGVYTDGSQECRYQEQGEVSRTIVADLWTRIATKFKNNPAIVGFDLANEPGPVTRDDSVGYPGITSADIKSYYNEAYKTIRGVDPNRIIIMEAIGAGGSNNLSALDSPADNAWTNVVYSTHDYPCSDEECPVLDDGETVDTDAEKLAIDAQITNDTTYSQLYNVPIYIGEFNNFDVYNNSSWVGKSDWGPNETWQYAMDKYDQDQFSYTAWTYKLESWNPYFGLIYRGLGNAATPSVNLETDPYDTILTAFSAKTSDSYRTTSNAPYSAMMTDQLRGHLENYVIIKSGVLAKAAAYQAGDNFTLEVRQEIPNTPLRYAAFSFSEQLPNELQCVSAELVRQDAAGKVLATIGPSNVSISCDANSQTVSATATEDFLSDGIQMDGSVYTLRINVKVKDDLSTSKEISNSATTTINASEKTSNAVVITLQAASTTPQDVTPPKLSLIYSPDSSSPTVGSVVATISSNEPLATSLPDGWSSIGGNQYQKTFKANTTETPTFLDVAGNKTVIAVKVSWIKEDNNNDQADPNNPNNVGGSSNTGSSSVNEGSDSEAGNSSSNINSNANNSDKTSTDNDQASIAGTPNTGFSTLSIPFFGIAASLAIWLLTANYRDKSRIKKQS